MTDNIGALWKPRTDNTKAPILKGTIELAGQKVAIVIWPNRFKAQDIADGKEGAERKPDYFIQLDKPREQARPSMAGVYARHDDKFTDDLPPF